MNARRAAVGMSFRRGIAVVAGVIGEIRVVLAQLLRRLFDLVERIAVERVVQHVFKHCEIDARGIGIQVIAVGFYQGVDNPTFLTWLEQTVKR